MICGRFPVPSLSSTDRVSVKRLIGKQDTRMVGGDIRPSLDSPNNSQFFLPWNTHDSDMNLLFPAAGAERDAEPPHLPARPPGGHSVCVPPDHSGPGGGNARQPAQLHRHPAAVRHEDLPQPPAGQATVTVSLVTDP